MERVRLFEAVVELSSTMAAWALLLIGSWATVTVLSNEKMRPSWEQFGGWRLIYILLIISTGFAVCSIYQNTKISEELVTYARDEARLAKARIDKDETLIAKNVDMIKECFKRMLKRYRCQRYSFLVAVCFMGLWLALYMVWWIFCQKI